MKTTSPEPIKFPSALNDLIPTILTKLPVRSLFRFRCVSKFFNSMIDRCYLTAHLNVASFSPDSRIKLHLTEIVYVINDSAGHRSFNLSNSLEDITLPNVPVPLYWSPPRDTATDNDAMMRYGYDHTKNQYKVLRFWRDMCHVFAAREGGSWEELTDAPTHYPNMDNNGVCVNGNLYYKAVTTDGDPMSEVVVAFSLVSETFRFIHVPYGGDSWEGRRFVLMHLEGHLVLLDKFTIADMWVLKDSLHPLWVYTTPAEWIHKKAWPATW